MNTALLLLIRLYWRAVPAVRRRRCLFRITCSRYVYGIASTRGFRAGIAALLERLRSCRPGYTVAFSRSGAALVCADGSVFERGEVADDLLPAWPGDIAASLDRRRLPG